MTDIVNQSPMPVTEPTSLEAPQISLPQIPVDYSTAPHSSYARSNETVLIQAGNQLIPAPAAVECPPKLTPVLRPQ